MRNIHNNMNGGTVARIAKMRRYRDDWNASIANAGRKQAGITMNAKRRAKTCAMRDCPRVPLAAQPAHLCIWCWIYQCETRKKT